MVASAAIALGLLKAGLHHPAAVPGHRALLNALVALYIYLLVPEFTDAVSWHWLLMHTIYRVHKEGLDRIPAEGRLRDRLQPRQLMSMRSSSRRACGGRCASSWTIGSFAFRC